ncbi:MAG: GAF domain-containing protein [Spirochaetota bacterium]
MIESYTFEDYQTAFSYAKDSSVTVLEVLGLLLDHSQRFYYILTILALKNKLSVKEKIAIALPYKINKFLLWHASKNCPENFESQYLLVLAEEARTKGKLARAMDMYKLAIEKAKQSNFLQNIALCNELAAKFYISLNNLQAAEGYWLESISYYQKWGAFAKVKQLEEKYPEMLLRRILAKPSKKTFYPSEKTVSQITYAENTSASSTYSQSLDLNSIVRASQAISGVIEYEKLLESLIKILIETAGAERVILIGVEEDKLVINAEGTAEIKKVYSEEIALGAVKDKLPSSIIQLVLRTKNPIVIDDAYQDEQFHEETYFKESQVRSVLCSPLINKGILSTIIYLENNLTSGAFTKERIDTLNTLASQAAISIENAKLYNNLEYRVKERTKEIGDIMDTVEQGILTINPNLTMNSEYSRKVNDIFAVTQLKEEKFISIFPLEIHKKLETFLTQLFQNKFMSEKMFVSLNPLHEYKLQRKDGTSKYLSFHFSRIYKEDIRGIKNRKVDKLMVVIDDKTEEYRLQQQLETKAREQANKVEKLYQILNLKPSVFTGFLQEGSEVVTIIRNKLSAGIDKLKDNRNVEESYRAIHTLKGNARALNLDGISEVCHQLEDELDKVRNNLDGIDQSLYELVQKGIDQVELELRDGNSLFEKILGMKTALSSKLPSHLSSLESLLRNIVQKESTELQIKVDFSFQSELQIDLSQEKLQTLKNPLLQIVRNSLAHGLEDVATRKRFGKPETGKLQVLLQEKEDKLIISCSDDGRGLDASILRQKAIAKNLMTTAQANSLSDEECYKIIFYSGFSTAERVTGTAGRGVGMDIVKTEIEKAGGEILVETEKKKFTKFIISISM